MKYRVDLTIDGYLVVDADNEGEARAKVEDGYSMADVVFDTDDIGDIFPSNE